MYCRPEEFAFDQRKPNAYIEDDLLPPSDSESDDDGLGFKVVNANKQRQLYEEEETDDSEDEDDEDEEYDEDDSLNDENGDKSKMEAQDAKSIVEDRGCQERLQFSKDDGNLESESSTSSSVKDNERDEVKGKTDLSEVMDQLSISSNNKSKDNLNCDVLQSSGDS